MRPPYLAQNDLCQACFIMCKYGLKHKQNISNITDCSSTKYKVLFMISCKDFKTYSCMQSLPLKYIITETCRNRLAPFSFYFVIRF